MNNFDWSDDHSRTSPQSPPLGTSLSAWPPTLHLKADTRSNGHDEQGTASDVPRLFDEVLNALADALVNLHLSLWRYVANTPPDLLNRPTVRLAPI